MTKATGKRRLRKQYAGDPVYPAAPMAEALLKWRENLPPDAGSPEGPNKGGRWEHLQELTITVRPDGSLQPGVSCRAIGRYVSGESAQITRDHADRLCIAMGIHLSDVYPYEPAEAAQVWIRVLARDEAKLGDAARLALMLLEEDLGRL